MKTLVLILKFHDWIWGHPVSAIHRFEEEQWSCFKFYAFKGLEPNKIANRNGFLVRLCNLRE